MRAGCDARGGREEKEEAETMRKRGQTEELEKGVKRSVLLAQVRAQEHRGVRQRRGCELI